MYWTAVDSLAWEVQKSTYSKLHVVVCISIRKHYFYKEQHTKNECFKHYLRTYSVVI